MDVRRSPSCSQTEALGIDLAVGLLPGWRRAFWLAIVINMVDSTMLYNLCQLLAQVRDSVVTWATHPSVPARLAACTAGAPRLLSLLD